MYPTSFVVDPVSVHNHGSSRKRGGEIYLSIDIFESI
jgi:hypothetical protein